MEQPHSMYLAEDSNEGDGKYGKFNLTSFWFVTLGVWNGGEERFRLTWITLFNDSIAMVA